jgi:hypothetical protein
MIDWLCTQEHYNPEVAIVFGKAARYRLAAVSITQRFTHRGGSFLSHFGFVENFFFISPRTQVLKKLPAFFRAFLVQMWHSFFFSGPVV